MPFAGERTGLGPLPLSAADVALIPVGFVVFLLAIGGTSWLITETVELAKYIHTKQSVLTYALSISLMFVLATVLFYFREINKKAYIYPPVELGVSIALAAAAVRQVDHLLAFVALLASVRVGVDGLNRLLDFSGIKPLLQGKPDPK